MGAQGHNLTQALTSQDSVVRKTAEDKYTDILQTHVRGDCIVDQIITPRNIGKEDLDGQVESRKPMRWEEKDTRSPGAMTMAFGGGSINYYMDIPRFIITYNRLTSFRLIADVSDLLTYRGDITQLYHDYLIKDIVDQRDVGFLTSLRVGAGNLEDPNSERAQLTGAIGYSRIGQIGRNSLKAVGKALPSTEGNLPPKSILVNNSTIWDFVEPDHDEVGGPKAEEIYFNGFTEKQWGGLNITATSKNRLIKDGDGYIMADGDTLGRSDILKPLTFYNRSEAWFVDMQCYMEVGGALPNLGAWARFDLSGSFNGWSADVQTEDSSSVSG